MAGSPPKWPVVPSTWPAVLPIWPAVSPIWPAVSPIWPAVSLFGRQYHYIAGSPTIWPAVSLYSRQSPRRTFHLRSSGGTDIDLNNPDLAVRLLKNSISCRLYRLVNYQPVTGYLDTSIISVLKWP